MRKKVPPFPKASALCERELTFFEREGNGWDLFHFSEQEKKGDGMEI